MLASQTALFRTINSATSGGGGAVELEGSKGDASITNCTFQYNSAILGGAAGADTGNLEKGGSCMNNQ